MKGVEERLRELVVACGDCAVDLETADHALYAVAFAIDASVPTDRGLAMRTRRDRSTDAASEESAANRIGVVALVGEQVDRMGLCERGHRFERCAIRRFAASEAEDERDASGITETMNLTGEPAPRAAKSLFASPPYAPAVETWPRNVVLPMLWRELSAVAYANVEATTSQAPASLQRRKRWDTVIHFPYFSGTSRHGAPVRMRHRMPSTMGLLSDAGRLFRPRSAGSKFFSRCHSASLRSPRLKNPSSPRGILESRFDSGVNCIMRQDRSGGGELRPMQTASRGSTAFPDDVDALHSLLDADRLADFLKLVIHDAAAPTSMRWSIVHDIAYSERARADWRFAHGDDHMKNKAAFQTSPAWSPTL